MNLTLTERRTVIRALPRAVAAELAERFAHAVAVVPTFDRRRYALIAGGYVGWVRVQGHTITFRPKRPWAEVRCLFTGTGNAVTGWEMPHPVTAFPVPETALLNLLAHRLATLMLARASAGLLRGYVERELTDVHLRGRIDLPSQLRRPYPQPTLFDQIADEWTPDTPWNRLPKTSAVRLLAEPGLNAVVRDALERAVAAFADVSDTLVSAGERAGMTWDARTEPYRDLIGWCDLIGTENVLVNLERAFEGYATRVFVEALGDAVRVQRDVDVGTLTLTPDITVYRQSTPASVWDVKWKRPDPTAADVHQALAYAAVLGVPSCGLVYPGRRWQADTLRAGSGVALQLVRLPLTDDPVWWGRVVRRVRRVCSG